MVLPGNDPVTGAPTTVIAAQLSTDKWVFHVPTQSHSVVLASDAVASLSAALNPAGPAAVVLALQQNNGEITFLHAPVVTGTLTALPSTVVSALSKALGQLRAGHRKLGAGTAQPTAHQAT